MIEFAGVAEPLSRKGVKAVLTRLGVGVPELLAVLAVESRGVGFLPDRRPIILFERHYFHKLTKGVHSQGANLDISNAAPGGYQGGAAEYARLGRAVKLDRRAALQSASWGLGQIMGANFAVAGFADVEPMVAAMRAGEDEQLGAVASFLLAGGLADLLRVRDWAAFARKYNGPAYEKNKYDVRLAAAYEQYKTAVPDIEVRRAQLYLTYLGYAPGAVDGLHGKRSRSAVLEFRKAQKLGDSERVDAGLLAALQARVAAQ